MQKNRPIFSPSARDAYYKKGSGPERALAPILITSPRFDSTSRRRVHPAPQESPANSDVAARQLLRGSPRHQSLSTPPLRQEGAGGRCAGGDTLALPRHLDMTCLNSERHPAEAASGSTRSGKHESGGICLLKDSAGAMRCSERREPWHHFQCQLSGLLRGSSAARQTRVCRRSQRRRRRRLWRRDAGVVSLRRAGGSRQGRNAEAHRALARPHPPEEARCRRRSWG
ncbi:unnamed protein product [Phaeothamnion confervicola]